MMQELASLRSLLREADDITRAKAIAALTPDEAAVLLYDWGLFARDNQLTPQGLWRVWLILAGRGWGKTRTGAEYIRERIDNGARRAALVGRTAADVRDVMVEGESGLLNIYPPGQRPLYVPSQRRVEWPNGAIATCYSADKPDQLRGPQHDVAWADELASWRYTDAWDQLMFGLRLGDDPRVIATTTPRPTPLIKGLLADPNTVVSRGSTFDNRGNLAGAFLDIIIAKYQGTRLGRQELEAEILDDNPNALWQRGSIEGHRVDKAPELVRIVVAIDPAATSGEDSDETGIVAAGKSADGRFYVLADRSLRASPKAWATAAVNLYYELRADRIVAEANNGGDMIEAVIRSLDRNVSYNKVHASRGKLTRAEPIASLYEQGRVHHVGTFSALEDQMCEWEPGQSSPDRMDALVWALTELSTGGSGQMLTVTM